MPKRKRVGTTCCEPTCDDDAHGVFPSCKRHLRGSARFRWTPPSTGLATLQNIPHIHDIFDLSDVTEAHIDAGKRSHVPLICKVCEYAWSPMISDVIHGGTGCPDCGGNVPLTLDRLLQRARTLKKTELIDFGAVTEDHIDTGTRSHIPLQCKKCKYAWSPMINDVIHGDTGCPYCATNGPYTIERLLKRARALNKTESIDFGEVTEDHIDTGTRSRVPLLCKKCKFEWSTRISNIIHGHTGCPDCAGQAPYTIDRLLQRARLLKKTELIDFGNVTEAHIVAGNQSHIPLRCRKCKFEWLPTISNVLNKNSGCPKCRTSKMEAHGMKTLASIQSTSSLDPRHWQILHFEPQFRLEGSQHRPGYMGSTTTAQKADFMLRVRIADGTVRTVVLELDGQQHFQQVYFGGGVDTATALQKRRHDDLQKDLYCKERGWCILRISYSIPLWQFDECIRHMLTICCSPQQNTLVTRICKGDEYA
jgi:predicted Zn-ribbon and HTH transcriptional regulator/very-short-patch-repair endonuclease